MSIGKLKLQQIAFWIVAGAVSASAATLVTKSGKILTDYTIQRQDGLVVIVSHRNGINKISIADLPDAIARRYVEPAAKRRIAMIMREKDPAQRVKKLEELISQLPAAEEYAKEPLAQAQREKGLEDKVADALAAKTVDERLRRLGEALEQSGSFSHVAQRIKKLSQANMCTLESMSEIMNEEKKDDLSKVVISHDVLRKYFPKSYTPKQMETQIIKLLDQWYQKKNRNQGLGD